MSMSVDYAQLATLREIHERLKRAVRLRKEFGLSFYRPHAKQDMFHRAGTYKYRYARTGNRFGKSEMGSAEDVAFLLGERPWYAKDDPARTAGIPRHPTKGILVCEDWDKSTEIFTNPPERGGEMGKLFRYIPVDALKGMSRNHSGAIDRIVVGRPQGGGESAIHIDTIQSFKQNKMSQESSAWDFCHIDEPCPQDMYKAIRRGLVDREGKTWFTCTPLSEMWINDMFVPNRRVKVDPDMPQIHASNRWMMTGSMYNNPHNKKAEIDDYGSLLTKDEIETRLHGIPLEMSGVIYKEFLYDMHVYKDVPAGWTAKNRPPKDYTIRLAIDPHPRTPHAVLFAATSPYGYTYFYDEIYDPCIVSELCDQIKSKTKDYYVQDSIIDPIANTKDPISGQTWRDEFNRNGVWCENATKDLSGGICKVKEYLQARPRPDAPRLLFSDELTETLFEFDHYIWDDNNKPDPHCRDHMMEDLYRLCLLELEYIQPPTQADYDIRDLSGDLFDTDALVGESDFDFDENGPKKRATISASRAKRRQQFPDAY